METEGMIVKKMRDKIVSLDKEMDGIKHKIDYLKGVYAHRKTNLKLLEEILDSAFDRNYIHEDLKDEVMEDYKAYFAKEPTVKINFFDFLNRNGLSLKVNTHTIYEKMEWIVTIMTADHFNEENQIQLCHGYGSNFSEAILNYVKEIRGIEIRANTGKGDFRDIKVPDGLFYQEDK